MATKDTKRGRGNINATGNVDERKLKQEIATSDAAEKLLENATLNKAINAMKENSVNLLLQTKENDRESRESIFFMMKASDSFKKELATYINRGATANLKLENKQ